MREFYTFYEGVLTDIESGLKDKGLIETLSEKYSISRTHLQRLFKNEFKQNIGSYIRSRKLAASIEDLKNPDNNILDIALDYGFEYEQSYIRSFRQEMGITPGSLRKSNNIVTVNPSLLLDNNLIVNKNNFRYELWKDNQTGNNSMLLKGDGLLKCKWNNVSNIVFRAGRSFDETKTFSQYGLINVDYGFDFSENCYSWRGIYGWTVDPLVQFFIAENCDIEKCFGNDIQIRTANISGDKYYIFEINSKLDQPSIKGNKPFKDYWSIRADRRNKGIVSVSEHFKTWERMGMKLGKLCEISVSIAGYKSSAGDGEIYRNLISIDGTTIGSKDS